MTTSLRQQLEARNGAKDLQYVPTSTQHARLLPGHKELKKRTRTNINDSEVHYTKRKRELRLEDGITEKEDDKLKRAESESDDRVDDTGSSDEYDDEDDEEEEEEDDEEALLDEWNRVRQERIDSKSKEKKSVSVDSSVNSNTSPDLAKPQKSGWRSKTVFGRHSNKSSESNENKDKKKYINDLSRSAYHKDFMQKHVK